MVDMGRGSAKAQGQRPGPEGGACWEGWEGSLGAGLWLFSTTAGPWLSGWSMAGPGHRSSLWHRPWERDPTSRAGQVAGGLVAQDLPHLGGPGSEQLLHTCWHVSHFLVPLLSRLV